MAEDINSITIVGRLTKDAELKYTNTGMAVTKMSLAVNRSVKKNDEWTEEVSFFDVTLWGKRGESLNQYLQKGTKLAINGSLVQDRWEQDGQKRSRVTINAQNIQLLGGNQSSNQSNSSQARDSYTNNIANKFGGAEDNIPF